MTDFHPIDCDECDELLDEFALGALSLPATEQVVEHLAQGCETCNRRLADTLADIATVAHAAPTRLPPLEIERQLMQRVSQRPTISVASALGRGRVAAGDSSWRGEGVAVLGKAKLRPFVYRVSSTGVAAAALVLTVFAWWLWRSAITDESASLAREAMEYHAGLQRRIETADATDPLAAKPPLQFVSLRQAMPANQVVGYLAIDDVARQWHIYVFNLPPVPSERRYQIWFVGAQGKYVSAGNIDVDAEGSATRLLDFPTDVGPITALAISDEPAAGSIEPTGEIFLQAEIR